MKIKRSKRAKKAMSFYTFNFGFHEPFQVLVDGTMCMAALQSRLHLKELIPDHIGSQVQLLATRCLFHELEQLGEDGVGAKLTMKRIQFRNCHHKKHVKAKQCMLSMIGETNEHRYVVATADTTLIHELEQRPGIPILTINHSKLSLRRPTPASLAAAEAKQHAKLSLRPHEQEVLKKIQGPKRKEKVGKLKKRGPKGPNPLSVKRSAKAKAKAKQMAKASVAQAVAAGQEAQS